MITSERLTQNGYVVVFAGEYSYDTVLVGVTEDERAVCDSDKIVTWLGEHDSVDDGHGVA